MAVLKFKLSLRSFPDHCSCTHDHMWGLAHEATEPRLQPDLEFSSRVIPESNQVHGVWSYITSAGDRSYLGPFLPLSSETWSSLNLAAAPSSPQGAKNLKHAFASSPISGMVACRWTGNA